MREKWARRVAYFTGLIVLLLTVYFARIQNPPVRPEINENNMQEKSLVINQDFALGKQVYIQQGCAMCHTIKGQGNPRYPLDGVGLKHTEKELHNWVIGDETIQGLLPERSFKLKQMNRSLSHDELELLVYYLKNL